jgi:hypothetical protein
MIHCVNKSVDRLPVTGVGSNKGTARGTGKSADPDRHTESEVHMTRIDKLATFIDELLHALAAMKTEDKVIALIAAVIWGSALMSPLGR